MSKTTYEWGIVRSIKADDGDWDFHDCDFFDPPLTNVPKWIQDLSDQDANIIFGTCRDPKMDDELKITMVAAAFPVVAENQQLREAELERLLQDVIPQSTEELDVPSFLRRQAGNKNRGFFR